MPKLLRRGFRVKVLDWYLFGDEVLAAWRCPDLVEIRGDLRDTDLLRSELSGCEAVIHLACISNDPSFELNPGLSRGVNYEAFGPLVEASRSAGVRRFIYASTSSVYGVSDRPEVAEDHPLLPVTDYNKYKGLCEPILLEHQCDDFTAVVIRPATVCGYSTRQRLDLTVNILTNHAVHKRQITVFGGSQMRPNIHVEDVTDLYCQLLDEPAARIGGEIFNAGFQNLTVDQIATVVRNVLRDSMPELGDIPIVHTPSDDVRSYHISSKKIQDRLGYVPRRTIEDAVRDLAHAFVTGKLPDSMSDPRYFNIKLMQTLDTDALLDPRSALAMIESRRARKASA